jgi:hypothetical protein
VPSWPRSGRSLNLSVVALLPTQRPGTLSRSV